MVMSVRNNFSDFSSLFGEPSIRENADDRMARFKAGLAADSQQEAPVADILSAAEDRANQVGRRQSLNITNQQPSLGGGSDLESTIQNIQAQSADPLSAQGDIGATTSLFQDAGLQPATPADPTQSPTENFLGSLGSGAQTSKAGSGTSSFGNFGNTQLPAFSFDTTAATQPAPLTLGGGTATSGGTTASLLSTGNSLAGAVAPIAGAAVGNNSDGAAVGSAVGAAIGTAILPGIGTAIGSVLGSLAGSSFDDQLNPREIQAVQLTNQLKGRLEGGSFQAENGELISFENRGIDNKNPLSPDVVALVDPVAEAIAGGDEEVRQDISAILASPIIQASGDRQEAVNNIVRAVDALGLTMREVNQKLRTMFNKGQIDPSRRQQYSDLMQELIRADRALRARGRAQREGQDIVNPSLEGEGA